MRPIKTGSGTSAKVGDLKRPATKRLGSRARGSGAATAAVNVKHETAGIAHHFGASRGGSGRTATAKD